MKQIRKRLTYANVMSSLAVFMVLGGATAIAARSILPKKSVGTPQLKANAVKAGKIKKNAVTKAKIRKGAVNGTKIANGSIKPVDVDVPAMPFSQVVHQVSGGSSVAVSDGSPNAYPLDTPVYNQPAGRSDMYIGAVDLTFHPSCAAPRSVTAYLLIDSLDPTRPDESDVAAIGVVADRAGGEVSARADLSPFYFGGVKFRRDVATDHTMSLVIGSDCDGGTSGVTATSAAVDVIGTK